MTWIYVIFHAKMGDSDSGVGVMPGANSVFWQFGVGVGTGVKCFFYEWRHQFFGNWSRSRSRSQDVGLESESEPGLTRVAHL